MSRTIIIAALVLSAVWLAPAAFAIEPGSAACKRELQDSRKKMQESLSLIDSVKHAPGRRSARHIRRRVS